VRARTFAPVLVAVLLGSGCGLFGIGGCRGRYIEPVEGVPQATSCAESYRLEDREYHPWCAEVRSELLGPVVGRSIPTDEQHVVRAIVGVDPAVAVAVREIREGTMARSGCGRWRFSPRWNAPDEQVERIARRVTEPGTLSLS
jgi:hypothetical protein